MPLTPPRHLARTAHPLTARVKPQPKQNLAVGGVLPRPPRYRLDRPIELGLSSIAVTPPLAQSQAIRSAIPTQSHLMPQKITNSQHDLVPAQKEDPPFDSIREDGGLGWHLKSQWVKPHLRDIDWMEWLACYVSGALLMPRSRMQLHVAAFRAERAVEGRLNEESIEGQLLTQRTSELFKASTGAARVRMRQLGYL